MATASAVVRCELPLDRVNAALTDISFVSSGIPDVKSVEKISTTKARWNVEVDFGFVHKTMILESEVTKVEDTKIEFRASGSEASMNGEASLKPLGPNETDFHDEL
jgi:carbon monoxide dehydrogenase subunit G